MNWEQSHMSPSTLFKKFTNGSNSSNKVLSQIKCTKENLTYFAWRTTISSMCFYRKNYHLSNSLFKSYLHHAPIHVRKTNQQWSLCLFSTRNVSPIIHACLAQPVLQASNILIYFSGFSLHINAYRRVRIYTGTSSMITLNFSKHGSRQTRMFYAFFNDIVPFLLFAW